MAVIPLRNILLASTFAAGYVAAGCGMGMASSPTDPAAAGSVAMTATPDPVAAGATLTYTVTASSGRSGMMGPAPSISVHLPPGATAIAASGTGWTCSQTTSDTDAFETGSHVDLGCASALASMASPPLKITLKAPGAPGTLRACAVAGKGASGGASACVDSTVN